MLLPSRMFSNLVSHSFSLPIEIAPLLCGAISGCHFSPNTEELN